MRVCRFLAMVTGLSPNREQREIVGYRVMGCFCLCCVMDESFLTASS